MALVSLPQAEGVRATLHPWDTQFRCTFKFYATSEQSGRFFTLLETSGPLGQQHCWSVHRGGKRLPMLGFGAGELTTACYGEGMQTCPPVIGASSQTRFLSWAVGRQRPSRGWRLVGTQWLVGSVGLFWGHLPARGMSISSELRTQPLLCLLWPQGDDVFPRWVQVARWRRVWCLFVAILTRMARRHPHAQPGGSCSQGQARQRDVSQVLSMGLWTQGSLGEPKTLACSCHIASMGHLSLLTLCFLGVGGVVWDDLKNQSWGVLQLVSLLLLKQPWILRFGGPWSLPAGFSMSGGERRSILTLPPPPPFPDSREPVDHPQNTQSHAERFCATSAFSAGISDKLKHGLAKTISCKHIVCVCFSGTLTLPH